MKDEAEMTPEELNEVAPARLTDPIGTGVAKSVEEARKQLRPPKGSILADRDDSL